MKGIVIGIALMGALSAAARPQFTNAKFAPGTSATLGGSSYAFAQLEGWPTLAGSGLTVMDGWTFPGEEVGVGAFSLGGKLTFGATAEISFADAKPAKAFRGKWVTLGTAEGGIEGLPASPSERWTLAVDADGKTLKAIYNGPGLILLLR